MPRQSQTDAPFDTATPRTDDPRSSRHINAVATTIAKALTLLADGYRIEPTPSRPGIYSVIRPPLRPLAVGEKPIYTVDITAEPALCDCLGYENNATCKHQLGVCGAAAFALYLTAPFLPETAAQIAAALNIETILETLHRAAQTDAQMFPVESRPCIDNPPPTPTDADAPPHEDDWWVPYIAPIVTRRPAPKNVVNSPHGFGSPEAMRRAASLDY